MSKHTGSTPRFLPKGIRILHEDRDILVIDKPPGLLTIATDKEKTRTAYSHLTEYVRKGSRTSRKRIYIVHRLDRETSGILVFAKSLQAKLNLQRQWKSVQKKYLAVVHGRCKVRAETISSYLAETTARRVYSTNDRDNGLLSHTAYRVLKQSKSCALLEIDLLTGRKHQIRVHLAGIGHPIVGDRKYGKSSREHQRLALHAHCLTFKHPFSGALLTFETQMPPYLHVLVGISGKEPFRAA
jgi:tRNA pseudouridine32 synthase/23S rRNA pseudouridine746 synthase/23S rRNA pseudouridine1911/1915/1917 synthase